MVKESELLGGCFGRVRGWVGLGRWMMTGDTDIRQAVEIRRSKGIKQSQGGVKRHTG